MFNIFKKEKGSPFPQVTTDIHSHLIPDVDDGVNSLEEAVEIIKNFHHLGYKKLITTPHIMHEFYKNDADTIMPGLYDLKEKLKEENIPVEIEAAAEYYLDDYFSEHLVKQDNLLTFGDNYILVETAFLNAPFFLKDIAFQLNSKGYNVVLAHPERYIYLQNDQRLLSELLDMQVLFQLNISSIIGNYSKNVKKFALHLIEKDCIRFIGSDCHNLVQFDAVQKAINSKYFQRLSFDSLLNNSV